MAKKSKYQLEYSIRTLPKILFDFLSTPDGLAQWFADHVDTMGDTYIFKWDGAETKASVIEQKQNESIRYRWEDAEDGEYFEFKIEKNEITGDTALIVTDFALEEDKEQNRLLWDSQISTLTMKIGG